MLDVERPLWAFASGKDEYGLWAAFAVNGVEQRMRWIPPGTFTFWRTADLWVTLMEALGYPRFAAQGGDWGGLVAMQLGHKHTARIIGVHLHFGA